VIQWYARRVWIYQRGNQNQQIEGQTTQRQNKKDKRINNDLQSTTHKTEDRVTQAPLKLGDEIMCSCRVSSSCSTSGTRRVNLVTTLVICYEWGKDREVLTTRWTYPWSFCDTDIPQRSTKSFVAEIVLVLTHGNLFLSGRITFSFVADFVLFFGHHSICIWEIQIFLTSHLSPLAIVSVCVCADVLYFSPTLTKPFINFELPVDYNIFHLDNISY
jgi:hypothetical protein